MSTEAVASSKIEETVTSLDELMVLEAGDADAFTRNDTKEVANYTKALQHGLSQIGHLPIAVASFVTFMVS